MQQFATSERQAQAEQQLWKKNNFYDLKNQIALPKEAQKQISKVIEESYDTLKKINNREAQIMIQRNSVRSVEEKTFKRGSYLTVQSMTVLQYTQFSIMGQIARFVYNMLTNLIQIESQVDPITHELIKINQVPVMEIVTKILQCQNVWQQFNMVINIYDDDIQKRALLAEFIFTILSKIFRHGTQLGFAISITQFQKAVFNQKILDNLSADDVAKAQTEAFILNRQKNVNANFHVEIAKYYRGKFIELLKKKRESYTKKQKIHFWSLLQPSKFPNMNQMIQAQISGQIDTIKPIMLKSKDKQSLVQLFNHINDVQPTKQKRQSTKKMKQQLNSTIKTKKFIAKIRRS